MATVAPQDARPAVYAENPKSVYRHKKASVWLSVVIAFLTAALIVFIVLYAVEKTSEHDKNVIVTSRCDNFRRCSKNFKQPPLVIISFDGFRDSYLNLNITPTIKNVFDCGTHSKFMIPVFPSKTFPNHYSIATGLYPAWHGIVDNEFYDPNVPNATEDIFTKSLKSEGWYLGEPIWNTAQKFGLRSAVLFWPGSEALNHGMHPNFYVPYDSNVAYTERADKLLEWLNLPEDERPSLIQLYMEEPDASGHKDGPDSQRVRTGVITMDGILNYLTTRLSDEGLLGCVNLILVSDHGMQYINYTRAVVMDSYLPANFNESLFTGVVAHISIRNNGTNVDDFIANMKCQRGKDYFVYKTKLTPSRFHYGGSHRVGEVVILGRAGVYISKTQAEIESGIDWVGNHGYDNRLPNMRAIFGAVGPNISQQKEIGEFESIELYNLFADLLSISGAPNNGTKGHLYSVLRNPPPIVETPSFSITESCTTTNVLHACDNSCPVLNILYKNCATQDATIKFDNSSADGCVIELCGGVIYYNKRLGALKMIETVITPDNWNNESRTNCTSYIEGMSNSCTRNEDDGLQTISFFMNKDLYNSIDIAQLRTSSGFANGSWKYLADKIGEYVNRFADQILMYAGPIYDSNADSLKDSDNDTLGANPSHIFTVLMRCTDGSTQSLQNCRNPDFISYVLPITDDDFNCLDPEEYLFQNTARIKDVEMLTGAQFFSNREVWSAEEAITLKTRVVQQLW